MKRLIALAVVLLILIAGSGLTAQLIANEDRSLLPVLQIVGSPNASTTTVQPWKAEQLFLLIGAIVSSLVGFTVVLAGIFWFLDRGVRQAKAEAKANEAANAQGKGTSAVSKA
jgi:large-conductance mechanosensitive channel